MMPSRMTTINDVLSTPSETPAPVEAAPEAASDAAPVAPDEVLTEVKPRRRIWLRLLVGFVLGVLLCLGVAGGSLLALDAQYEGRVLSGVHVAGVDLSGLDRAQASAALTTALAGYGEGQVVVQTSRGDVVVPYSAFARRADVDAMVDDAMQTGRVGTPLERAFGQVRLAIKGVTIPASVALDPEALTSNVNDGVARLRLEPLDARVVKSAGSIYTMPAKDGVAFDGTAAVAAALEVVSRTDAPAEVVVGATPTAIPPAHDDSEAMNAKTSADRMIGDDVIVQLGKKKWTMRAKTVATWVRFDTTAGGTPTPTVNEAAIAKALKRVAKSVKTAPTSAIYLKDRRGRVVGVVPAKDGRQLDVPATSAAIVAALGDRAAGSEPAGVAVKTLKIAPKLTTEEAAKRGPVMSLLGTWKTWFPISDHNFFGANIWQPAKIINGTVLYPGQRFEWWSRVGPVTPARGFGPGGFIAGNHTEPTGALGGGMCSSSTTLFNAALRAGLQMGARSNHKYYIFRYPLGLDATVSKTRGGGSQTMSFTNDMAHPIVIRTYRYTAGGRGWVKYEIWGIPDGRTVSLSKPSVNNVLRAVTRIQYVSTLKRGVRMQTEFPANGMDVSVTRIVRKNGRVIHSDTYRTHYVLWNGIIQVGR